MTTNAEKIEGEILVDLMEDIIKTLPELQSIYSKDHTVLIHGMGGQPRSFFNNLRQNKDTEILWTGWSSKVWWTFLLSFIPGQSGLVKVLNRKQTANLYLNIGEQSMAALYFIPNKMLTPVLEEIKTKRESAKIENILISQDNYFILTVDFDTAEEIHYNKYWRSCIVGNNLDIEIKQTLSKIDNSVCRHQTPNSV